MELYLGVVKANQPTTQAGLPTDTAGRFVLPDQDAKTAVSFPFAALILLSHKRNREWQLDAHIGARGVLTDERWELTITDEYMTFWNPLSDSAFSGFKARAGKATAGIILFNDLDMLLAGPGLGSLPPNEIMLGVDAGMNFQDQTTVSLRFVTPESAQAVTDALEQRLIPFFSRRAKTSTSALSTITSMADPTDKGQRAIAEAYKDIFHQQASVDIDGIKKSFEQIKTLDWQGAKDPVAVVINPESARQY